MTNTKGLVKIEMQINSTKSDSDFSVVHIYRKLQEKISFLVSLDIKDMQKRYIPEKPRFYRGISRLRGVIFLSRNMDVKPMFSLS